MSFSLIVGQPQGPPNVPIIGTPPDGTFVGAGSVSLSTVSAPWVEVGVQTFVVVTEIIDRVAFANLPSAPPTGWSAPRRMRIGAEPVVVGGNGSGPVYAHAEHGVVTSMSIPPGSISGYRRVGPYDIGIPTPPFVPPKPIATLSIVALFVSLLGSSAPAGTVITFQVGS